MKMLTGFVVLIPMLVPSTPIASQARKDGDKLDGKWKVTKQVLVDAWGTSTQYTLFVARAEGGRVEIKGNKLITWIGKEAEELTITLNTTKKPKEIDAKDGKDNVVFRGIYELRKDSLHLCISGKGDRPKAFKHTPVTPLFEFKRE